MTEQPPPAPVNWGRRIVVALVVVALVVVIGFVASVTVPRWWAQRIGDQVDGSITQGILIGLFYGFFFTLLPLLAFMGIVRWRHSAKAIGFGLIVAILLALPNLMTLGIVLGRNNPSHAGERTLDVEAPAFRGASLAGAILAVLLAAFVLQLLVSRQRAREGVRSVREELARAKERPDAGRPGEPPGREQRVDELPAGAPPPQKPGEERPGGT